MNIIKRLPRGLVGWVGLVAVALLMGAPPAIAVDHFSHKFIADYVKTLMVTNKTGITNLLSHPVFAGFEYETNVLGTRWTNWQNYLVVTSNTNGAGTNSISYTNGIITVASNKFNLFRDVPLWVDARATALPYAEAGKSATNLALGMISVTTGYSAQSNSMALIFVGVPNDAKDEATEFTWSISVTNAYNLAAGQKRVTTYPVPISPFLGFKYMRLRSATAADAGAAGSFPVYDISYNGFQP